MDVSYKLAIEVFDLKESPSESDINKVYNRLAKCSHPDKGGDEKLFCFITECKNVLLRGNNSSNNSTEDKQNNSQTRTTSQTDESNNNNYYITLSDLYDLYYSLSRISSKYNITDIRMCTNMCIYPVFKKKMQVVMQIKASCDFTDFSKFGYVPLNCYVYLPQEFNKYNKFIVKFQLFGKTFKKMLTPNSVISFKSNNIHFDTILDVTLIKSNG